MDDTTLSKIAIKVLADRQESKYEVIGVPDEIEREIPAVDLLCRIGDQEYVVEHTKIESFPNQIFDSVRFVECFGPLETEFAGTLPKPGHYHFSTRIGQATQLNDVERVRDIVSDWIKETAPKLGMPQDESGKKHFMYSTLGELGIPIRLSREPGVSARDGHLMIYRDVSEDDDIEAMRRTRVETALDRKCPKLHDSKGADRSSVLCLEYNDIGLGNHIVISNAVNDALQKRKDDIPDFIVLIDSSTEPYFVDVLKEGDKQFPELYNQFVEVDPHDV